MRSYFKLLIHQSDDGTKMRDIERITPLELHKTLTRALLTVYMLSENVHKINGE